MRLKRWMAVCTAMVTAVSLAACGNAKTNDTDKNTKDNTTETESETTQTGGTVTIAAAASLEKVFEEQLIPMFNEMYPDVKVEGTYDSSGKLQTQIEEGADVDIFFSAATKQMDALKDEGMMDDESIVDMLENKIVLIVPHGEEGYSKFEDIVNAQSVAIGDPESVPAGQYGKEALANLDLWDQVDIVAEAPEGSCTKVIYPVGMLKNAQNPEAAKALLAFLQTDKAANVFEAAGFTIAQ